MPKSAASPLLPAVILLLPLCLVLASCNQHPGGESSPFAALSGPYLGQDPPGMTAEMFAPGLLTAGYHETHITFSPDGTEFMYTLFVDGDRILAQPRWPFVRGFIMQASTVDGHWSDPTEVDFAPGPRKRYPNFSPDGDRLFYNWDPPNADESDTLATNIWYVDRRGEGWSEPTEVRFHGEYSGKRRGIFPTVATSGNIYFGVFPDGANGLICVSRYEDGKYLPPESLYEQLQVHGNHVYIAPDESYMIFDWVHPDTLQQHGDNDLLISFRDEDGKWARAKSLGAKVNSPYHDWRPFVSGDGKYLFFSSNRIESREPIEGGTTLGELQDLVNAPANGFQHLYWIDAGVIEEARTRN